MLKKRITYFFKFQKTKMLSNFLIMFGGIWLCLEFPSFLSDNFLQFIKPFTNWILWISLFTSLIYAFIMSFPKMAYEKEFKASNTSIKIKVGDLINETCDIVVGTSDYFDTAYDTQSNISLKSQVINRLFNSDKENVDRLIENSLQNQAIEGTINQEKQIGKNKQYQIGTIAILPQNNRKIYLTIITNLVFENQDKHTETSPEKYHIALNSLWNKIKVEGRKKEISIPVIGSGLSGLNLSNLILMQSAILSFVVFSKQTRITQKLNVVIKGDNYNPNDFEEIIKFLNKIQI